MTDSHYRHQALELLADGFKQELLEEILSKPEFLLLLRNTTVDFVSDFLPIVNKVDQNELVDILLDKITISAAD